MKKSLLLSISLLFSVGLIAMECEVSADGKQIYMSDPDGSYTREEWEEKQKKEWEKQLKDHSQQIWKLKWECEALATVDLPVDSAMCSVVFFDNGAIHKESIEYSELQIAWQKRQKEYLEKITAISDKMRVLQKSLSDHSSEGIAAYKASANKLSSEHSMLDRERNDSQLSKSYSEKLSMISNRVLEIAQDIAKKNGANAILSKQSAFYVDPKYDITRFVFAQLNKEFLERGTYDFSSLLLRMASSPVPLVTAEIEKVEVSIDSPQEALYKAIIRDSAEDIAAYVKFGADVNKPINGKTSLFWAVTHHCNQALSKLLELRADINTVSTGSSLVHHAVKIGNIKAAIILVKNGANFSGNIDDNDNVMSAAIKYVSNPPSFNKNGEHTFTMPNTTLEFIQLLIDKGWNIKNPIEGYIGNSQGARVTNVWWETIRNQGNRSIEVLKLFIRNGADVNQVISNSGFKGATWTPLLLAVDRCDLESVTVLLDAGADINQKALPRHFQIEQHSPLSFATRKGHNEMIQLLLSRGAK